MNISSTIPPSTSSLVIQRTNFRALKYSNIGALFSRSASNIHTLTLALVTAVYRCFSSEFRTLCWFGSKVRALGRPVCCRTSGRKYIIQVFIIRMEFIFRIIRENLHTVQRSLFVSLYLKLGISKRYINYAIFFTVCDLKLSQILVIQNFQQRYIIHGLL